MYGHTSLSHCQRPVAGLVQSCCKPEGSRNSFSVFAMGYIEDHAVPLLELHNYFKLQA